MGIMGAACADAAAGTTCKKPERLLILVSTQVANVHMISNEKTSPLH